MIKYRFVAPALAATLLATTGCTQIQAESTAEKELDCLNTVDGPGDLEITESVLTPIGDDGASYGVKLTNNSKTKTAMLATVRITLMGRDGEAVTQKSDGSAAQDHGTFEYIPPGESKYWAGTWTEPLANAPADIEIDFPELKHPSVDGKTFWWPHDDVEYPDEVKGEFKDFDNPSKGTGGTIIADSESDSHYSNATAIVYFLDDDGKLVGGQEIGPGSQHSTQAIDLGSDETEIKLNDAFPQGAPSKYSEAKVQFTNSPPWKEVAPECPFAYDSPQPA